MLHPRPTYRRGPDVRFVVVSSFEWGPRAFVPGDAFPWQELGLGEWDVRCLWIKHLVDVDERPAPPAILPSGAMDTAAAPATSIDVRRLSRAERRAAARS